MLNRKDTVKWMSEYFPDPKLLGANEKNWIRFV